MLEALERGRVARTIVARPMDFAFDKDIPRDWMGGDLYLTQLMNALSLTFPDGEKFFVSAVRSLRDAAKSQELAREVRGFLAQEALHRREHDGFNRMLQSQGVDVERFYAEVAALLREPEDNGSPLFRLAITCALEHFTAVIAEMWLSSDLRQRADPRVRDLWTWHALEELDHKAVAFDLYRDAGGTYAMRALVMIGVSVVFMAKVTEMQARLMKHAGLRANLRGWARGLFTMWGPRGYFSRLVPAYLRYFQPNFHPWQQDDSALIARFEGELSARRT